MVEYKSIFLKYLDNITDIHCVVSIQQEYGSL